MYSLFLSDYYSLSIIQHIKSLFWVVLYISRACLGWCSTYQELVLGDVLHMHFIKNFNSTSCKWSNFRLCKHAHFKKSYVIGYQLEIQCTKWPFHLPNSGFGQTSLIMLRQIYSRCFFTEKFNDVPTFSKGLISLFKFQ